MVGEMENQSGTLDGEGLKKCATTGLYEPPPHRGEKAPLLKCTSGLRAGEMENQSGTPDGEGRRGSGGVCWGIL